MKKNVGTMDMVVRGGVGAVLLFAGLVENSVVPQGGVQGVLLAAGALVLLTAALRFCPLYKVLGVNTKCGSCKSCTCKSQTS